MSHQTFDFHRVISDRHSGLYDMFIMKLDSAGTPQWTVQTGGSGSEVVHAFHIDASGNMFLAGYTDGQLHGNSHAGGRDIFAMKLNAAVSWQWTFQTGSASHDVVRAMQIDALGNVVLAGETYGGLQGSNAGFSTRDIFAMELDSAGSHLWTFQSGSSSDDEARGLRVEGTDILLAGRTKGSLGGANSGSYDIFVMGPARPTTSTRSSTTTTTTSTSRTSTRTTITWTSTSSTTSRSLTFSETQITGTTSITITTTGTTSSSRTTDTATESTSRTSGTATFTTSATSQTGSSTESHTASTTTSASMTSSGVSTTSSTSMGSSFTTTSQSITATSSQTTTGFVSLATGNTWIWTTTHIAMVPPSVTMTTTFETATSSASSQATLTSTATTTSVSSTVALTWSSAEGLEAGALVASILILLAFCLGTCTACLLRLKAGQKGETKRNEKDEAGLPLEELRISTETWQDRTIEAQQGELSRGIEVDLASAKTPLESTDENAKGGSIEKVQQVEEMGRIDPNQEAAQKAGASSPHVSKAVEVSHSVMKPEENQADSQALTNVYIGRPEGANNPSPKKGSRFRSHWTCCVQNTLEPDTWLQDPLAELPVQDGAQSIEHQLAADLAGTFATATDIKSIWTSRVLERLHRSCALKPFHNLRKKTQQQQQSRAVVVCVCVLVWRQAQAGKQTQWHAVMAVICCDGCLLCRSRWKLFFSRQGWDGKIEALHIVKLNLSFSDFEEIWRFYYTIEIYWNENYTKRPQTVWGRESKYNVCRGTEGWWKHTKATHVVHCKKFLQNCQRRTLQRTQRITCREAKGILS